MMDFTLPRTGNVPLQFHGKLLAHESSNTHPRGMIDLGHRWQEISIFLTDTDKWVTEVVGRTTVEDETDRTTVNVCETPAQVRQGVSRTHEGRTFVTNLGLKALASAVIIDPRLEEATTERI